MTVPGGALKLNSKKDLKDPDAILNALFANASSRAASIDWLGSKQQIFALDDPKLIEAINSLCPNRNKTDSGPKANSRQRLAQCLKSPCVQRLKELEKNHHGPFQDVGQDVSIGFPKRQQDRPQAGHANVCRDGDFVGSTLWLTDADGQNGITVVATGRYPCPDSTYPDVQLNPADARKLFPNRSWLNQEQGEAVVVSP